jgi:hypothetical protein
MNQAMQCMVAERKRMELCDGTSERKDDQHMHSEPTQKTSPPLLQPPILPSSELVGQDPRVTAGNVGRPGPTVVSGVSRWPERWDDRGGIRNLRLDTGNFKVTSGKEQGGLGRVSGFVPPRRPNPHPNQRFMDSAVVTKHRGRHENLG